MHSQSPLSHTDSLILSVLPLWFLVLLSSGFFIASSAGSSSFSWSVGANHTVIFHSNATPAYEFTSRNEISFGAHLPGFSFRADGEVEDGSKVVHLEHFFIQGDDGVSLEQHETGDSSTVTVVSNWNGDGGFPPDFIHLLYGILRKEWIRQGSFPIHAACVGNDDVGYTLLAGAPGSGKTSLALQSVLFSSSTAMRKEGLGRSRIRLLSGDKTLLRFVGNSNATTIRMDAIAGTRTMTIRLHDREKWRSLPKVKEVRFDDRIAFQLASDLYAFREEEEEDVGSSPTRHYIRRIVLVGLNPAVDIRVQLSSLSALHTLYPFLMDKQREDTLIGGSKAIFDGTIPKDIRLQLARDLEQALLNIPVFKAIGSLESVSSFIQSFYDSPSSETNAESNEENLVCEDEDEGEEREEGKSVFQDDGNTRLKILFGVCGIGNGHINRQLPVIRHYAELGHRIAIFTYGNGVSFFGDKDRFPDLSVFEVANPYYVGHNGTLDFQQTALTEKNRATDFNFVNSMAIHRVIAEFGGNPDLVISDYELVAARLSYAKGVPLVTLDQQSKFLIMEDDEFPSRLAGESYMDEVERLSMIFPAAAKRIAVSFFRVGDSSSSRKKKKFDVQVVPPSIRPELLEPENEPFLSEVPSILVYMTSQQLEGQETDSTIRDWIQTIEETLPPSFEAHLFLPKRFSLPSEARSEQIVHFYHHGDQSFTPLLLSCHGVITTAGHTLLSEAMFLGKPVYALPLSLYEQQLSAHVIHKGGFGVGAESTSLSKEDLLRFAGNLDLYARNIQNDARFLFKEPGNRIVLHEIDEILSLADRKEEEAQQHRTEVKFLVPELARFPPDILEALKSGTDHPEVHARGYVVQEYLAVTTANLWRLWSSLRSAGIPFGSATQLETFTQPGRTQEIRLMRKSIKLFGGSVHEVFQVTLQGSSAWGGGLFTRDSRDSRNCLCGW